MPAKTDSTFYLRVVQDESAYTLEFDALMEHMDDVPAEIHDAGDQVAVLVAYAEGRISHRFFGHCPDKDRPGARDETCAVCAALGHIQNNGEAR